MRDNPQFYITLFGGLSRHYRCIGSYKHWVGPVPGEDYWMDIVEGPYIITNTFNLCVLVLSKKGTTTFLPTYSEKDRTNGMLVIRFVVVSYF